MIVFDLDGTLRDVSCGVHAVPDDVTRTENWVMWQDHVNQFGGTLQKGVDLYALANAVHDKIAIVTSSQHGTKEWLNQNDLRVPSVLIERKPNDHSTPFDYKRHFIDVMAKQIKVWVDDCAKTCEYASSVGIQVIYVGSE